MPDPKTAIFNSCIMKPGAGIAQSVKRLGGRGIAQTVSRWLPTATAWVWQVGFVVDKVASGQVFSEHFGFLCQTIHSTRLSILTITGGRYSRPVVAAVPSGPSMDSTSQC
jgi:hypothetical protein